MAQVFCAYCGKSFTRKEHLERHIPSRETLPHPQPRLTYIPFRLTPHVKILTLSRTGAVSAIYPLPEGEYTILGTTHDRDDIN